MDTHGSTGSIAKRLFVEIGSTLKNMLEQLELDSGRIMSQLHRGYRKDKRNGGGAKSSVAGGSGIYHGNVKSKVLHGYGCSAYNCMNCTSVFGSVDEALDAGYRTHRDCVKQ